MRAVVHSLRKDDSILKYRRDRGKGDEIIALLLKKIEELGGSIDLFFGLAKQEQKNTLLNIAECLMGAQTFCEVPLGDIVRLTGKSDYIREWAVACIPRDVDLPFEVLDDRSFDWPLTRLALIERLPDQGRLRTIAHSGRELEATLAAARLTSEDDLVTVATQASIIRPAAMAISRLSQKGLAKVIYLFGPHAWSRATYALSLLTDVTELELLLENKSWPAQGKNSLKDLALAQLEAIRAGKPSPIRLDEV